MIQENKSEFEVYQCYNIYSTRGKRIWLILSTYLYRFIFFCLDWGLCFLIASILTNSMLFSPSLNDRTTISYLTDVFMIFSFLVFSSFLYVYITSVLLRNSKFSIYWRRQVRFVTSILHPKRFKFQSSILFRRSENGNLYMELIYPIKNKEPCTVEYLLEPRMICKGCAYYSVTNFQGEDIFPLYITNKEYLLPGSHHDARCDLVCYGPVRGLCLHSENDNVMENIKYNYRKINSKL